MRIYRYVFIPMALSVATASLCQADMISYVPAENKSLADFSLDSPVLRSPHFDLSSFALTRDILNPVQSQEPWASTTLSDTYRYSELAKQVQNKKNVGLRKAFEQAVRHLAEERSSRAQALIEEYQKIPRTQRKYKTLKKSQPERAGDLELTEKLAEEENHMPKAAGLCAFAALACLGVWLRRRK